MFGDYEAQRHWMEITLHLPMRQWYFYDLPYWGLDYPPLTAYVSWVCGYVGSIINPDWFMLSTSRGIENPESKSYLRFTVIVLDLLIYVPAVVFFCRRWWKSRSHRTQAIAVLMLLFQPSLILIDHGHFQYNSVMLGLTLWSINLFHMGYDVLGAIVFVLSMGFKQMALYYAPAIFGYLFGKCLYLRDSRGTTLFAALAAAGISTVLLLFAPFLQTPFPETILQPIARIFPFARGLFEDKVANFWCASNVLVKWREQEWARGLLPIMALCATLGGILPSTLHILSVSWSSSSKRNGEKQSASSQIQSSPESSAHRLIASSIPSPAIVLLPYALFNSSLAFFMFSFQVHEKSILLPLLPLTLLASAREDVSVSDARTWEWGLLFNNVATFSMWPLLQRDGQQLQYILLIAFWNYLLGYNPFSMPKSFIKGFSLVVYGIMMVLHIGESFVPPSPRYPDLYAVLNVLLCAPVFGVCWLWGMRRQVEVGWAISSLGAPRHKDERPFPARTRTTSGLAPVNLREEREIGGSGLDSYVLRRRQ